MAISYLSVAHEEGGRIETPGKPDLILPPTWRPPLVGPWMESVTEDTKYVFDKLMPADSNVIVSGKAKRARKSWMVEMFCLLAASGVEVAPFVPVIKAGLPTLYCSAEGARISTKERKEWLQSHYGIDIYALKNYWFSHREGLRLDDDKSVSDIKSFVKYEGIKFLVFDPIVMFSGSDENDARAMMSVFRTLNEFRGLGATVVFVHHLKKDDMDKVRDVDEDLRGTSAIAGFYDQHWAFRQTQSWMMEQGVNELTVRSKDLEDKRFEVEWFIDANGKDAYYRMDEMTEEALIARHSDELVMILAGGQAAGKERIEEMLKIRDAGPLIDALCQQGVLAKTGKFYKLRDDT